MLDHGLVSKNVARISLAHNAPAGTLDKVAMEIEGAASALFTKKTKLDSDNAKRHPTKRAPREGAHPVGPDIILLSADEAIE